MWGWNPDTVIAVSTAFLFVGVLFAGIAANVAIGQARSQTRATRASIAMQIREWYSSDKMLEAIEYLLDRTHPERRDPLQYLPEVFIKNNTTLHQARRRVFQFLSFAADLVSEGRD